MNYETAVGMLTSIPSPGEHTHEISTMEFTFMGAAGQPDQGTLTIQMAIMEGERCPELKGLKVYLQQYRNKIMSYERAADCLYGDLMTAFEPEQLYVELVMRPRGGLHSRVAIGRRVRPPASATKS